MDQRTYIKRFAIWTAIICAAVIALCGIFFGRVIEENLFAEIAKWVVVSLGVIGICIEPLVIVVIAPFCYHCFYEPRKKKAAAAAVVDPIYSVTENNIHIDNSCDILKNDFQGVLSLIKREYPETRSWKTVPSSRWKGNGACITGATPMASPRNGPVPWT